MNITQEQIDALDALQSKQNDGRGISCVQTMLVYLRRGEFKTASYVRNTEGDKTISYKDVEALLTDMFGCRTHGNKNCDNWICKK